MSSKYGMAAQGLGVAILLGVVYFAFLAPNDPESLSGIDAPGGEIFESVPNRHGDGNGDQAVQRSREPAAVIAGAAVAPSSPVPTTPAIDTPPGSQYDSVVARIIARVRARP